ncbi:MAG TPA: GNAT family N-acetyltransferase [Candidatus Absconditabacterales bacterium]|nr:GNAT family N-acetyltransferase [Candidatus Absconditabacterales bacterium]HMT26838.1 GNAT family N-acetyltransferase [Candidatus Absconditabacterales bacterium]
MKDSELHSHEMNNSDNLLNHESKQQEFQKQVLRGISGFEEYESHLPDGVRLFNLKDYDLVGERMTDLTNFYDGHTDDNKLIDQLVGTEKIDQIGYFTKSKLMLMFEHEGVPLGMVCLNIKRGGSVKIGPVIVAPEARGKGIGKLLFSTIDKIADDFKIRKLYATTSHLNDRVNSIFSKYGYNIEATYPDQYKQGSNEHIWGKIQNESTNENLEVINSVSSNIESVGNIKIHGTVEEEDKEYLDETLRIYRQRHNDLGADFLHMMLKGYERGKENLSFQNKSKMILIAKDEIGNYVGTLVYSPKRGGPVKIYPISGTPEAQSQMIQQSLDFAKENGSHKLYTFAHENDFAQIDILEQIGFTLRGKLISPYKNGHNLLTFDLFVKK